MVRVVLTSDIAERFADGETELDVEAHSFRILVKALDTRFPGIGAVLRSRMSVAIDGEIVSDPLLEDLSEAREVCFIPQIRGG